MNSARDRDLAILSFNLGHDGAVALVQQQRLVLSIEREKDSRLRHSSVSADLILDGISRLGRIPDVIAISSWHMPPQSDPSFPAYHGFEDSRARTLQIPLGQKPLTVFISTHERAHLFCSFGLSPYPQDSPCYVLLWEGVIGRFYEIKPTLKINVIGNVIDYPGYKYSFLYDLANPVYEVGKYRLDSAGKLMALASYSKRNPLTDTESRAIEQVLFDIRPPQTDKAEFDWSPFFNCGVTDPIFTEFAGKCSDAIFDEYFRFAKSNLTKRYPLLIAGGCGLNCDWNSRWRNSGLFEEVFVPPITNDSGVAIGTAVEAQHQLTGDAKLDWNIYSGLEFTFDKLPDGFIVCDATDKLIASLLDAGNIIAWVQGRFELGPRALGNRSLLAAPFRKETADRLNQIKHRELYRPIAPVCLDEDASVLFGATVPSPYMLYLYRHRSSRLAAVTHVDGTARLQTVSRIDNPRLYSLLKEFKKLTGFGVLCNTSLNYPGRGFINRSSDLFKYVLARKIDGAVIGSKLYTSPQSFNERRAGTA